MLKILILLLPSLLFAQVPSAQELLEGSIRYHDPEKQWGDAILELHLRETRPNGPDRKTRLIINNHQNKVELVRIFDGHTFGYTFDGDEASITVDGKPEFPEALREKYRLTPERALFMRNYYVYLWGLPMKLRDPGTRIDEAVQVAKFDGRLFYRLRVTYDPDVGHDIWYFYFDRESHALTGYRFYRDEAKNDGEFITLEGMKDSGTIRLPKLRKWYTHADSTFLGADELVSLRLLNPDE